jgi:hypothetical protein
MWHLHYQKRNFSWNNFILNYLHIFRAMWWQTLKGLSGNYFQHNVTYSGFFYSRWNFIALQKSIHYSYTQSATLRTHVHVRPARSRNTHSYRILPPGPLVAIFQHSLPFLQSESFQIHVGTIHRRAIDPLAHHNGTSAYTSLTCTSPDDRMSSSSMVLTRVLLSQFPIWT